MKVTIDTIEFKQALAKMRPGEKDTRSGILHGVKIEARGKSVVELMTGTRDYVEVITLSGMAVEAPGSVVLPYTRLKKIVASIKEDEFAIESTGADAPDRNIGWDGSSGLRPYVRLVVGEDRHVEIPASCATEKFLPSKGKPTGSAVVEVEIDTRALAEVGRFASNDINRPILTAVSYERGDLVATDSYRLAVVTCSAEPTEHSFLIPATARDSISRLCPAGPVKFDMLEDGSFRHYGDGVMFSFKSDKQSQFPNWKNLMDGVINKVGQGLEVGKDFRDAFTQAYGFYKACDWDHTPLQVEQVGDHVVLTSRADDTTITVRAAGKMTTGSQSVAFNPRYLASIFEGTNVDTIFGTDSIKPWGIHEETGYREGSTRTRLLMPVRVS